MLLKLIHSTELFLNLIISFVVALIIFIPWANKYSFSEVHEHHDIILLVKLNQLDTATSDFSFEQTKKKRKQK